MTRKLVSLSGPLVAVSHVFYLSKASKIFFLQISNAQNSLTTAVVSLSSSLPRSTREAIKKLLVSPPLGNDITITSLKNASLYGQNVLQPSIVILDPDVVISAVMPESESSGVVLRLRYHNSDSAAFGAAVVSTRHTTFNVSANSSGDLPNLPSSMDLVSYKGIVTKTKESQSGCYTLDKNVDVITSLMCIATSVPQLQLGGVVTIHRAHLVKWQDRKFLLLCGSSFIEVEGGQDGKSWPARDLLQLRSNYLTATKSFGGKELNLEAVLRATVLKDKDRSPRSLTKEFLCHNDGCSLSNQKTSRVKEATTL